MLTIAKINCKIHASLIRPLLDELTRAGIQNIYNFSGRMAILEDPRGLAVLMRSADLVLEPVEVLSFFVPLNQEEAAIALVAKACDLQIPGRGSVYSEHLQLSSDQNFLDSNSELALDKAAINNFQIFKNLVSIGCIVQRGHSDNIVRMLLQSGVVPTVIHGEGTGIRDRLGLLRITLPKEKDMVSLVVGAAEADFIMEEIIQVGQLERPGRGFIYQTPVSRGIINFKSSNRKVGHAASIDQIIAAIDSLKGESTWRQGSTGVKSQKRRNYLQGIELSIFLNEGFAAELSKAVMQLGLTGATVLRPKLINPSHGQAGRALPTREIVRIMLPEQRLEGVLNLCQHLDLSKDCAQTVVLRGEVPRAYTYQRLAKKLAPLAQEKFKS